MHQVFAELFGGVGLFLLGMTLMINGLKDATGETLKKLLTKFTETQFKSHAVRYRPNFIGSIFNCNDNDHNWLRKCSGS